MISVSRYELYKDRARLSFLIPGSVSSGSGEKRKENKIASVGEGWNETRFAPPPVSPVAFVLFLFLFPFLSPSFVFLR